MHTCMDTCMSIYIYMLHLCWLRGSGCNDTSVARKTTNTHILVTEYCSPLTETTYLWENGQLLSLGLKKA